MTISKGARAVVASVVVLIVLVAAWIVGVQAFTGRWSLHTALEFTLLFALPLTMAVVGVCLPVFVLLSRYSDVLLSRMASVMGGASLSAVPAIILFALFFGVDSDRPQTVAAWGQYGILLLPFAVAGAAFGFIWSAQRPKPSMHS